MQETSVWSLVRKICWRRKRQPVPVFLPGESHGQRNLVGYSSWGRKESDMTDQLSTHAPLHFLLLPWLVLLYFICWFSLISPTARPLERSTTHCFFSSYLPSRTWWYNPVSTLWWPAKCWWLSNLYLQLGHPHSLGVLPIPSQMPSWYCHLLP